MATSRVRTALGLSAVVLSLCAPALPAHAAPVGAEGARIMASGVVSNTDRVRVTDTRFNARLNACVKTTFSSNVTYTAEHTKIFGGALTDGWAIRRIRFTAPTTTATILRYDSVDHRCTTTKQKVKKLKVSSEVAGFSCNWNPQVSVGAPFSIALGFWPDCADHNKAVNSGSGSNTATKKLYDDDGYVRFPNQVVFNQGATPSFRRYGVRLVTKVTRGDSTHTVRSSRKPVRLTPNF